MFLSSITGLVLLALILVLLFQKLKLPSVLAYMTTGILLQLMSSYFSPGTEATRFALLESIGEIGVMLLLFAIGMEFSVKQLIALRNEVFIGGTLQMGITALIIFVLLIFFDFTVMEAAIIGYVMSISSSALAMKLIEKRGEISSAVGRLSIGILIWQDILTVLFLSLLTFTLGVSAAGHGGGGEAGAFSLLSEDSSKTQQFGVLLLKFVVFFVLIGLASRFVIPRLFLRIAKIRDGEIFLWAVLAICLATITSADFFGLGATLGAFLAGLLISETDYAHEAHAGIIPFKDFFIAFFFVYIGYIFDTTFFMENLILVVLLGLGMYALKFTIVTGVSLVLGYSLPNSVRAGLYIGQVGEFALVVITVLISGHVLEKELTDLLIAVICFTFFITPLFYALANKTTEFLENLNLPKKLKFGFYSQRTFVDHTFKHLNDHIVIVGFHVSGKAIANIAKRNNIPYCITELNPDTVMSFGEKEPIIYGNAKKMEVLDILNVNKASCMAISIPDSHDTEAIARAAKQLNPNIVIVTKAIDGEAARLMTHAGADETIISENLMSYEFVIRIADIFDQDISSAHRYVSYMKTSNFLGTPLEKAIPNFSNNIYYSAVSVKANKFLVGLTVGKIVHIAQAHDLNIELIAKEETYFPAKQTYKVGISDTLICSSHKMGINRIMDRLARNVVI